MPPDTTTKPGSYRVIQNSQHTFFLQNLENGSEEILMPYERGRLGYFSRPRKISIFATFCVTKFDLKKYINFGHFLRIATHASIKKVVTCSR
jgi:hypothetical protein